MSWTLPMDGGCRCGAVRFRIDAAPMMSMACHCTGCQRMSGSAFSLTVMVPTAGFRLTEGETVRGGLREGAAHHQHCDACKSWVFTRVEPDMGFVNVRATMLDDTDWFEPFVESWTDEKLAWVTTPARHSFAQFPPMEAYQPLMAEFAALHAT
ncbi:Aldehyde-activating protein [Sphingomonas sp. EC-HK361]|uniref:GFA family protein n=1 Tax=Sphingomonas sp. EC-HK361 TaxID=2038397 RepID=UPI001257CA17|nr:GFA family protein [Sphingomonas sp. EC-HK361]VVT15713.1 Aldehyde-activating protein [Sphingomonas sp. EC-HK361]